MTARGTILLGLLLCAAILAGTQLAPAPSSAGACEVIEVVTNGARYKPGYHAFGKRDKLYTWSVVDGNLVIESGSVRRVEFAKGTIETFHCILPTPTAK